MQMRAQQVTDLHPSSERTRTLAPPDGVLRSPIVSEARDSPHHPGNSTAVFGASNDDMPLDTGRSVQY